MRGADREMSSARCRIPLKNGREFKKTNILELNTEKESSFLFNFYYCSIALHFCLSSLVMFDQLQWELLSAELSWGNHNHKHQSVVCSCLWIVSCVFSEDFQSLPGTMCGLPQFFNKLNLKVILYVSSLGLLVISADIFIHKFPG